MHQLLVSVMKCKQSVDKESLLACLSSNTEEVTSATKYFFLTLFANTAYIKKNAKKAEIFKGHISYTDLSGKRKKN